jgi:hypothetical protein
MNLNEELDAKRQAKKLAYEKDRFIALSKT